VLVDRAVIASDGIVAQARVVNLAMRGCLLETDLCLTVGQVVDLSLFLNGHLCSKTPAIVRWVHGRLAGTEFVRLSGQHEAQLEKQLGVIHWTGMVGG
jgi:hypothetical protein